MVGCQQILTKEDLVKGHQQKVMRVLNNEKNVEVQLNKGIAELSTVSTDSNIIIIHSLLSYQK